MTQNPFEFNLYPKQKEFLTSTAREVLYAGGAGAGKSHAMAIKLFLRANRPGAIEGLVRKFSSDIDASFLELWRKLIPDTLNGKTIWTYHDTKRRITLEQTGGVIYLFGVGDREQLGSKEMSGCGVEEAAELTKGQWTKLLSLCRREVEGIKPQIFGCCNPSSDAYHWLIAHFDIHGNRQVFNRHFIKTNVDDIEQTPEFKESLESFDEGERQRLRLGEWVTDSGQVFNKFTDEHIKALDSEPIDIVCSVDDGYTDPFVCLKLKLDSDKRVYVEEEFVRTKMEEAEKVDKLQEIASDARIIVVDNCGASLISAIRTAGMPVIKSRKSVSEGLSNVRNRLLRNQDGKFRLFVNPNCRNLIRELRTYAYNADGSLERNNNHSIDALIYGLFILDSGRKPFIYGLGQDSDRKREEGAAKETVAAIFQRMREGNPDFGFE